MKVNEKRIYNNLLISIIYIKNEREEIMKRKEREKFSLLNPLLNRL